MATNRSPFKYNMITGSTEPLIMLGRFQAGSVLNAASWNASHWACEGSCLMPSKFRASFALTSPHPLFLPEFPADTAEATFLNHILQQSNLR